MLADEDRKLDSLLEARTIAVIGLSKDPAKYSHRVAAYLKGHGYKIIPINPFADEVLGEKSFPSLFDVPAGIQGEIELVDIFRPSEETPPFVDQAIELKRRHGRLKAIWMQQGIVNEPAAARARAADLEVVMNKCIMAEHRRLRGHTKESRALLEP